MSTALSENLRLAALDRCGILDTPPDPHFDRITRLAAQFFGAPMAAISFVAHDRSWFKSTYGFQQLQLARSASFCSHTIGCPEALVIPDATADARFAGLALVAGHPRVRFYAGVPVFTAEGFAVGAVAVMDTRPRGPLSESEICTLHDFSALISRELNARPSADGGDDPSILSAVVQSAEDAIVSVDLNGAILTWNPAAERLFGYSAAEVRGRPIDVIIPPDRFEESRDIIEKGPARATRSAVRDRQDSQGRKQTVRIAEHRRHQRRGWPAHRNRGYRSRYHPSETCRSGATGNRRPPQTGRRRQPDWVSGTGLCPAAASPARNSVVAFIGLPASQTTMSYAEWLVRRNGW